MRSQAGETKVVSKQDAIQAQERIGAITSTIECSSLSYLNGQNNENNIKEVYKEAMRLAIKHKFGEKDEPTKKKCCLIT